MNPTILTSHREKVDASEDVVWKILIDKIKNPQNYITGVKSSTILKEQQQLVHRSMIISMNGKDMTVEEYITWNDTTKTVVFKMINNPLFEGYVVNQILKDGDKVLLDFTMNWQQKDGALLPPNLNMESTITAAVIHTKNIAEGNVK